MDNQTQQHNAIHQHVDHVITSRHSVRAFLDTPIEQTTIRDILAISSRAPSGTNTQPWNVYVVTGQKRASIITKVQTAYVQTMLNKDYAKTHQETFDYYPSQWISPYIDRRRENGWSLYGLLNIQKGDKEKMLRQHARNYQFFDAPVGLFFTVNTTMGVGSKMDLSMMIQNVMLAAKARGIDSCPQAAWNPFHTLILPELGAKEDEELVCAVALGYADSEHIVNTFNTPRVPVDEFTTFLD